MSLFDKVLSYPKIFDIYNYNPCCGGEFFTSLIRLSHPYTKQWLKRDRFIINPIKPGVKIYDTVQYHKHSNKLRYETFGECTPEELLFVFKYSYVATFSQHLAFYRMQSCIDENWENHLSEMLLVDSHHLTYVTEEGYSALINDPLMNILQLDPETLDGKKLIRYMNNKIFPPEWGSIVKLYEDKFYGRSDVINFPFIDYMLYKDNNGVMDFLEERYGSDLDFDFIDESLTEWREVRLEPYL